MRIFAKAALLLAIAVPLSGCNPGIPPDALKLTGQSLQDRQMETKRFSTDDEKALLVASAQVLQDMGFTINESATKLGVIAASKDASAVNTGQVVAAVVIGVLFGVPPAVDQTQKIKASIVTQPFGPKETSLRVTFQRLVWDNRGALSHIEFVGDKEVYKDFFTKLSKSVFLTANDL